MRSIFFSLSCVAIIVSSCASQAQSISVNVVPAFPNLFFDSPTDIQHAGDGSNRLFVCEKKGVIRVFQNRANAQSSSVFLDLSDRVVASSELGLLGLAFHPDYSTNGYFYVNYNIRRSDSNLTVISRFSKSSANPDVADKASELVLMEFYQPFANHDGGQVAFGPDGYLYIATGDGGSGGDPLNAGQSLNTLLGKILRIDVDNPDAGLNYGIPESNAFRDTPGARKEIYAYGLRNPWRFSFDPETDWLWAADVGQDKYEEIDIIENGKNYGWKTMEGWHCYSPSNNCDSTGLTGPVWEYGRSSGASITGGYVYRGNDVPALVGKYVYADFVSGRIWALFYDGENPTTNVEIDDTNLFISTFGLDENQELYFGAFDGRIYKFSAPSSVNNKSTSISGVQFDAIRPNPAADHVVISYQVSERVALRLSVHDARGEEVAQLVDDVRTPGSYQVEFNTEELPEAVYYVRLITDKSTTSQSLTIVR